MKKLISIISLTLLLLACNDDSRPYKDLRTKNISSAIIEMCYPPFTSRDLTIDELKEVISYLNSFNTNDYKEIENVLDGDPISIKLVIDNKDFYINCLDNIYSIGYKQYEIDDCAISHIFEEFKYEDSIYLNMSPFTIKKLTDEEINIITTFLDNFDKSKYEYESTDEFTTNSTDINIKYKDSNVIISNYGRCIRVDDNCYYTEYEPISKIIDNFNHEAFAEE